MKGRGQQKAHHAETEQASAHLSDSAVVDLFLEAQTTEQESHAHDQQQVRQDGAQQRCLHDSDLVLHQRDDENDQLDGVTERDIDQGSDRVAQAASHALCRMAQQASQRDDRDGVHREDHGRR